MLELVFPKQGINRYGFKNVLGIIINGIAFKYNSATIRVDL
jgi:hypothetical protein